MVNLYQGSHQAIAHAPGLESVFVVADIAIIAVISYIFIIVIIIIIVIE